MKFLCLHGAIGNKENFSVQLQPLEKELTAHGIATLITINGPCSVTPPAGFLDYFGAGPHYRWFDDGGAAGMSMLARIRELPFGETPEDVIRNLAPENPEDQPDEWYNRKDVLDLLYRTIDSDPEIGGLLGYSEGAALVGSFILDEARRHKKELRPRQIRCAVFLTGWPPLTEEDKPLLSDESKQIIDIPTLHMVGANDPYKDGAVALYNVCDEETAIFFDTGKAHTLPRSGPVLGELVEAIGQVIEMSQNTQPGD